MIDCRYESGMSDVEGSHTVEIAAPPERCVETILAMERYPEWYDTLDLVVIAERDRHGRPALVTITAAAGPLGDVVFDLRYAYEGSGRIVGTQEGGNGRIVAAASAWTLEPVGAATTRATYEFRASAGGMRVKVALRAARLLVERDLIRGLAEALKSEVEG